MFKKTLARNSKGFTLIEVLVATFILVMVGVVAVAIERNFMASGTLNKHRLQATGLAQEGMSTVRADFTTNLLKELVTDKWQIIGSGAIKTTPDPNKVYYLDISNNLQECPSNSNNCSSSVAGAWNVPLNGVTFTRIICFGSSSTCETGVTPSPPAEP